MKPPSDEPIVQHSELEGGTSAVTVHLVITQQGMASPRWSECILFRALCSVWLVMVSALDSNNWRETQKWQFEWCGSCVQSGFGAVGGEDGSLQSS